MTSTKKHIPKKLITDKGTDYLFDYFMNEEKFNEQLRKKWDEEMEKKMENHRQPNLDSRILTEKVQTNILSSDKKEELPSKSGNSSDKSDVDFNDEDSNNETNVESDSSHKNSTQNPTRSLYGKRIDPMPCSNKMPQIEKKPQLGGQIPSIAKSPNKTQQKNNGNAKDNYINYQDEIISQEERRARARDAYSKLEELVDKYGVKLSKKYTIDDDPDEMEAEYKMHHNRRNKSNQVKFYKQILLGVVTGLEFLNEKYNPFEFKLEGWSKQVAFDMDDYTEILEEIYERWKDRGGNMAPEIRLMMMIVFSGAMYHVSQTLFGSEGLNHTLQNNPSGIQKLLKGIMGDKMDKPIYERNQEPIPTNNKDILEAIRKHNQKVKQNMSESNIPNEESDKNTINTNNEDKNRKMMEDIRAEFESKLKKTHEMYASQIENLQNRLINEKNQTNPIIPHSSDKLSDHSRSKNQILSDARKKPRFYDNPLINNQYQMAPIVTETKRNDISSIFENDKRDLHPINDQKKLHTQKQPIKGLDMSTKELDVLIETLEESTEDDLEDIIKISNENKKTSDAKKHSKKTKNNNSISEFTTTTSKRKNNVIKL